VLWINISAMCKLLPGRGGLVPRAGERLFGGLVTNVLKVGSAFTANVTRLHVAENANSADLQTPKG